MMINGFTGEAAAGSGRRTAHFLALFAIAALAFGVYANSLGGDFLIGDDELLVRDNAYIRDWKYLPKYFTEHITAGAGDENNYYRRPLQVLSYAVDYSMWGLRPFGYHLSNVVLHASAAACLYLLLAMMLESAAAAFFAAALWAIFPPHAEAVAFISGRADPLAAIFMFAGFIFYLRSRSVAAVACYVAALLSRESAVVFPALLVAWHAAFRKKPRWIEWGIFAAITLLLLVLRAGDALHRSSNAGAIGERVPMFLGALAEYARILFFPVGLHMDYGFDHFSLSDPRTLIGSAIFLAGAFALWRRRRGGAVFFSILWFFISLFPVSHIVPLDLWTYLAVHWLYLPSVGFFIPIGILLARPIRRRGNGIVSASVFLALLAYFSFLTLHHNRIWHDTETMNRNVLRYQPESYRAYYSLGVFYGRRNEWRKAAECYMRVIRHNPKYPAAYYNLGNIYMKKRNARAAIFCYQKAIEARPAPKAEYYNNLGNAYAARGQYRKAIECFRRANGINPALFEPYYNLGSKSLRWGRYEEAVSWLEKAAAMKPGDGPTLKYLEAARAKAKRRAGYNLP